MIDAIYHGSEDAWGKKVTSFIITGADDVPNLPTQTDPKQHHVCATGSIAYDAEVTMTYTLSPDGVWKRTL